MTHYLLFILYLDYRNDIRQKALLSNFFFYSSSKWVEKQWRQPETSVMYLAQELLMNIQCSGGSRSFAKEMSAGKHSGQPSEAANQLRAIIEANPLTTTQEVAKEFNVNRSMVIPHFKQIGKVKKLDKWVPHELTGN